MSLLVVIVVAAIAAAFVRLPYEMVAPGSARQVNDLLSVKGTKVYPPDGKLYYATVSVRDDINPYEFLRASIDPNIDLVSSKEVRGSISPSRFRQLNVEAMASSKQAAEVVALRRLGIEAATGRGALITEVARDYPAASVLRANDVIVAIDGKQVKLADDAIAAIRAHRPGHGSRSDLEDQGQGQRAAAPGIPLHLRATHLGAGPHRSRSEAGYVLGTFIH